MNWQYIAGFFDGEGTIPMTKNRGMIPGLSITQTGDVGKVALLKIQEFASSEGVKSSLYFHVRNGKNCKSHYKSVNLLCFCGRDNVIRCLEKMRPHLIIKKQITEDLIRFSKIYPSLTKFHYWTTGLDRKESVIRNPIKNKTLEST